MAFYKEEIRTTCDTCKKRPHKLYQIKTSGSSPSYGQYCEKCAEKRVKELTDIYGMNIPY